MPKEKYSIDFFHSKINLLTSAILSSLDLTSEEKPEIEYEHNLFISESETTSRTPIE